MSAPGPFLAPLPAPFDPAADPLAFRRALGAFATGVTVVTARGPGGPVGITANSFASVSLDPPLVLWCPARSSRRFRSLVEAPRFAVHVLAAGQRDLAAAFTREAAPEGLAWEEDDPPLLPGCLARLVCARHAVHEGGDHAVVLGRVLRAEAGVGAPLVFHGGRFGGFAEG